MVDKLPIGVDRCQVTNAYGQQCDRVDGHPNRHHCVNRLGDYYWVPRQLKPMSQVERKE